MKLSQGLVQIYTGNGKGKTTAALGLVFRAAGHGFRSLVVSFLKGGLYTGELYAAERLYPLVRILQFGRGCPRASLLRQGLVGCPPGCADCFIRGEITPEDRQTIQLAFAAAAQGLHSGEYQIVVLDEIINAINLGLVDPEATLELLRARPAGVEAVLTGRSVPTALAEAADLVTKMELVKHPYQAGVGARRGIEY